jgi:hypothetical protein
MIAIKSKITSLSENIYTPDFVKLEFTESENKGTSKILN